MVSTSSAASAMSMLIFQDDFLLMETSLMLPLQANALKMQKRMHWTRHPAEKAADIVEKVLLTEGDEYLQTGQHILAWWQNSLLDVYVVIASMAAMTLALISLAGCGLYRACKRLGPRTVHAKQQ